MKAKGVIRDSISWWGPSGGWIGKKKIWVGARNVMEKNRKDNLIISGNRPRLFFCCSRHYMKGTLTRVQILGFENHEIHGRNHLEAILGGQPFLEFFDQQRLN